MDRLVATLPDSVEELCLVRLGILVRRLTAWPYVLRLGRAIQRASDEATRDGSGLLQSDRMIVGPGHFVVLQYWSSFEALEAWSHRPPHSEWWKGAVERMRTKSDFGIYHETYLIPRNGLESIYLNAPPVGLSAFGPTAPAVGRMTTSRDRLDRRAGRP